MLTRIEIDGFKSFSGFVLDLMPFCAVIGPNASGKSNLFDALRLLSRVVVAPDLREALAGLRGRASEQFRLSADGRRAEVIRLAAECLLHGSTTDAFQETVDLTHTRVRYEIHLERRLDDRSGVERIYVIHEAATPIRKAEDGWVRRLPASHAALRPRARYSSRAVPFLETETKAGQRLIQARQDGHQGRKRPAERATASFLSTLTTAEDFPHLHALRQALAGIAFLQLDPAKEREPSDFLAAEELEPGGGNIAAVLHRIAAETASADRPDGVLSDIVLSLSSLIPTIQDIRAQANEQAKQYELEFRLRDGQAFSARLVSDGTLRLLALVTAVLDPRRKGTLCFEEPENGVHQGRVGPLVELLRDSTLPAEARPFQVILNSHSPVVLDALADAEIIAADLQTVLVPGGPAELRTRMRTGVAPSRDLLDPDRFLTRHEIDTVLRQRAHGAA